MNINFDEQEAMGRLQESIRAQIKENMLSHYGQQIGTSWMHSFSQETMLTELGAFAEFINSRQIPHNLVNIMCASILAQNITNRSAIHPEVGKTWDGYVQGTEVNHAAVGFIVSQQMTGYMSMQPDCPQEFRDSIGGDLIGDVDKPGEK